jgi:hypothetical protein
MQTVNIAENCRGTWSPKILGEMNDRHGKAVKLKGEFVCHHHEHNDASFCVVSVPHGRKHLPVAGEETHVRLFESKTTLNRNYVDERMVAELERR